MHRACTYASVRHARANVVYVWTGCSLASLHWVDRSADPVTHRLAARSALAEHRAVGEDLDLHEVLVERRACPRRKTSGLIRRAVATASRAYVLVTRCFDVPTRLKLATPRVGRFKVGKERRESPPAAVPGRCSRMRLNARGKNAVICATSCPSCAPRSALWLSCAPSEARAINRTARRRALPRRPNAMPRRIAAGWLALAFGRRCGCRRRTVVKRADLPRKPTLAWLPLPRVATRITIGSSSRAEESSVERPRRCASYVRVLSCGRSRVSIRAHARGCACGRLRRHACRHAHRWRLARKRRGLSRPRRRQRRARIMPSARFGYPIQPLRPLSPCGRCTRTRRPPAAECPRH